MAMKSAVWAGILCVLALAVASCTRKTSPFDEIVASRNDVAYQRGVRSARSDLGAGLLQFRTRGLAEIRLSTVIAEKYGVGVQHDSCCVVSSERRDEDRGYNGTMDKELMKRHGLIFRDVVRECFDNDKIWMPEPTETP